MQFKVIIFLSFELNYYFDTKFVNNEIIEFDNLNQINTAVYF